MRKMRSSCAYRLVGGKTAYYLLMYTGESDSVFSCISMTDPGRWNFRGGTGVGDRPVKSSRELVRSNEREMEKVQCVVCVARVRCLLRSCYSPFNGRGEDLERAGAIGILQGENRDSSHIYTSAAKKGAGLVRSLRVSSSSSGHG
jgi:hypothetical protein